VAKLYRAEPPKRLSRDLILRAIAYRLQERTHGGLGLAIQRRLNALTEELEAKGAAHFAAETVLKPGTKLVREWHGRTHTVIVAEDGFEFDGQRYRSLTRVATLITGVHRSGPVFFGLKKRPAAAPAHPALCGLHPQILRGGAGAGVQLAACPARGLRSLRPEPAA
jgi:hypothetical protein